MHFICCLPLCPTFLIADENFSSSSDREEFVEIFLSEISSVSQFRLTARPFILCSCLQNSHGGPNDPLRGVRKNTITLDADGVPIPKRILPGINQINNQSFGQNDDGTARLSNGK